MREACMDALWYSLLWSSYLAISGSTGKIDIKIDHKKMNNGNTD
jgi:hypothetical protein